MENAESRKIKWRQTKLYLDMACESAKEFDNLKERYVKNEKERQTLIKCMQENLKNRTTHEIVEVLDGRQLSVDSDNVEELYAIDGALRNENASNNMTTVAENERNNALRQNKYSQSNQYPDK